MPTASSVNQGLRRRKDLSRTHETPEPEQLELQISHQEQPKQRAVRGCSSRGAPCKGGGALSRHALANLLWHGILFRGGETGAVQEIAGVQASGVHFAVMWGRLGFE